MPKSKQRVRGIYLLPSLFTTGGLFAAFYAIVAAMKGRFETAAIAVFIAMIADGLDGRIARLTNAQTPFGAEYDSLSDMVAFGLAPAILAYAWGLQGLGKVGWLAAFVYTAAVALRLARFNTQIGIVDKRYFVGLACPPAAAILVSAVWLGQDRGLDGWVVNISLAVLAIALGLLMVSNIHYYSFKEFDFKGRVPYIFILFVILTFVGISIYPPLVLFVAFSVYAFSGPITHFTRKRRRKKRKKKSV